MNNGRSHRQHATPQQWGESPIATRPYSLSRVETRTGKVFVRKDYWEDWLGLGDVRMIVGRRVSRWFAAEDKRALIDWCRAYTKANPGNTIKPDEAARMLGVSG